MNKKNIVIIGGGSASAGLLQCFFKYRNKYDLSAIGSLADNGGSNGKLQGELGVTGLGAIRKCLLALSEENEIFKDTMAFRFQQGFLAGQVVGNIFMAALEKTLGSPEKTLEEMHKILKIKGEIVPASFSKTVLVAELENGLLVEGETNIDIPKHDGKLKIKKVFLRPGIKADPKALEKISKAHLIIIGPGDFYTTTIPNLLVDGISEALKMSKAKKVFVANTVTKFGETTDFSLNDFVKALEQYLGKDVLDYVLYNGKDPGSARCALRHPEESYPKLIPDAELEARYEFIDNYFISENGLPYYDKDKLIQAILNLL